MFRKPNDIFASNKGLAATRLVRHWKLVFWRLLWFIAITVLFGHTLGLPFKQTEPYLTQDIHLLGQMLRFEIENKMNNGDTEQQSDNDDGRIKKKKAEMISKISQNLLTGLSATWYFVCVTHSGEFLAGAPASAKHWCDGDTIEKHSSGNLHKKYYVVQARKSGGIEIPTTLHSVKDGYGSGFHLWVVKRLQAEQVDPIYYLIQNNFVHVVLILGIIVLSTYALGHFIRQESRSKNDSGGERVD